MGSSPSSTKHHEANRQMMSNKVIVVVESASNTNSNNNTCQWDHRGVKVQKKQSKLRVQGNLLHEIKDETYCLILAAEEFYEQLIEHDDTIRAMSEVDTIHDNIDFICELLHRRNTLHGDLIRIQEILAQDDPMLQNLSQYEVSNVDIIDKLKEIRDQTKFMKESMGRRNSRNPELASFVPFNGDFAEDFTDYELPANISTKSELLELHKKEEKLLSERFALLISDNQDTDEDVTKILAEHTYYVQAMKIKQDMQMNKLELALNKKNQCQNNKLAIDNGKLISGNSDINNFSRAKNGTHRFSIFQRDESSEEKLARIIKTLEEMRDRNELTEESLMNILTRYKLVPKTAVYSKATSRSRASIIIQDSQEVKRQLQQKRQEMKNMMDAKLKKQLADVS